MNKARRKKIGQIVEELERQMDFLNDVLYDEQDAFDSIPENLQYSMRGEESQDAISGMEEAVEQIETVIEKLEEANELLGNAKDTLDYII